MTQIKLEALWVRSDLGIIYSYRRKKKKGAPQRTPNPNRETNQNCRKQPKNIASGKYLYASMDKTLVLIIDVDQTSDIWSHRANN